MGVIAMSVGRAAHLREYGGRDVAYSLSAFRPAAFSETMQLVCLAAAR